ncbi:metal-dependent transcriptional regulator [Corynebacterium sp. TAE3-ERU2]|uniref:metal-dependent transcriptional regulator n=1 Tax=Corynebacterium sp. TAE3-ERU2 TaxID=2849497 RepID=UPI001C4528DF|nr:FeoA domain-containing protein [Corynebacterium sp. TAE3-ERU2]
MKDLVDTTEMYLRTIYELEEEGIIPLRARIAERLEQSGPTVSQTVARMERDGLVVVANDRSLHLTSDGRQRAIAVMRKHRLAECLLTDVIGYDIEKVHDEACRWEHVMSDEVERRLLDVLPNVDRSPFGNPIPGLDRLGRREHVEPDHGTRIVDLAENTDHKVRIVQVNEILQVNDDEMKRLIAAGICTGSAVTVYHDRNGVTFKTEDKEVRLSPALSHAVRVEKA